VRLAVEHDQKIYKAESTQNSALCFAEPWKEVMVGGQVPWTEGEGIVGKST
jgi:hypothetical protein